MRQKQPRANALDRNYRTKAALGTISDVMLSIFEHPFAKERAISIAHARLVGHMWKKKDAPANEALVGEDVDALGVFFAEPRESVDNEAGNHVEEQDPHPDEEGQVVRQPPNELHPLAVAVNEVQGRVFKNKGKATFGKR